MIEDILARMSEYEFEFENPEVYFKCESAVFVKGSNNSLCYTTSVEMAKVLTAILNDWVKLRNAEKLMDAKTSSEGDMMTRKIAAEETDNFHRFTGFLKEPDNSAPKVKRKRPQIKTTVKKPNQTEMVDAIIVQTGSFAATCSICEGTGKDTNCRAYATSCQCDVCLYGYYKCERCDGTGFIAAEESDNDN